jgi:hypothetical protein
MMDEPRPQRHPSSDDILNSMLRGGGIGALVAATAGAVSLVLLLSLRDRGQHEMGESLMHAGVALSCVGPFGFVSGLLAGAFVGLVDSLAHGRISAANIPLWVWAIAGALLGAAGSSLSMYLFTLAISINSPYSLSFWDVLLGFGRLGAVGGVVAGPVFGWLYRRRNAVV